VAKESQPKRDRMALLESRIAYHLRCLREDAPDPDMTSLERLALEEKNRASRADHGLDQGA